MGTMRYSAAAAVQVSTAYTHRYILTDNITVHTACSGSGLHHKTQIWGYSLIYHRLGVCGMLFVHTSMPVHRGKGGVARPTIDLVVVSMCHH